MKTIKNQFDRACTYEKLVEACRRSKQQKGRRREIMRYEFELEYNITEILRTLKAQTYKPGSYRHFVIHEPKQRDIFALPFRDRIVHQWYVEEFIKPYFVPRFIADSYACVVGRGSHSAHRRLQHHLRQMRAQHPNFFIIKMDISKFFYTIDKTVLFGILARHITDPKLLNLTKTIVFDTPGDIGIPIGNYTSQYYANIYMNELDQFVKRQLKVKYYIRYMDDFVLLAESVAKAKQLYTQVEDFLRNTLRLRLNPKSRIIPSKQGVLFCGFRIFPDFMLLSQRNKRSIHHMIRTYRKTGDSDSFLLSATSWVAHVRHADSCHYRNRIFGELKKEVIAKNAKIKKSRDPKSKILGNRR
jgi:retron-type reverse transcriptase